jgi:hypothetical protein
MQDTEHTTQQTPTTQTRRIVPAHFKLIKISLLHHAVAKLKLCISCLLTTGKLPISNTRHRAAAPAAAGPAAVSAVSLTVPADAPPLPK